MPVASLIGEEAIGTFGKPCFDFIDKLKELGANYWQILPLNIVDKAGCPYASPSAFGGEPLLIESASLGLSLKSDKENDFIDYEDLLENKYALLKEVASRKTKNSVEKEKLLEFCNDNFWVKDLCVFLALRDAYKTDWQNWPTELHRFDEAKEKVITSYEEDYWCHMWLQKIFHEQWQLVRDYAELKGIRIIGDIPIFVSANSFDAWRWPKNFKIDPETGMPIVITGAPPDEFNDQGQLWGTINFNWERESVHGWWLKRLEYGNKLYDLTRIDHFVGFYHVWESSADASDARLGQYVKSNGHILLEKIEKAFPELPFIAEDLGVLNDEIRKLRDDFNYPTMRVYQFSLEEKEKPQTAPQLNEHIPHNVPSFSYYYSGTHDNNTLRGWLEDSLENSDHYDQLSRRFNTQDINEWNDFIITDILKSSSDHTIFPLQDIFKMPGTARINIPGTEKGNWIWRLNMANWDQAEWIKFSQKLQESNRGSHDQFS